MLTLLYLGVAFEMIVVNLTTIHLCSRKKYSNIRILAALFIYSVLLVGAILGFISRLPFYGNGNGAFVLAGFLYLLPLKLLYDESVVRILEILCSSWIYTMVAFMLCVHTARLFQPELFAPIAFSVQTVFYLATAPFFWKFIREKFTYVLRNIPEESQKYLRHGSILWFFATLAINLSFIASDNGPIKVIALIFLAAIALVSYSLIYEVTASSNSAQKMELIATTDYLTKLPNRYSLYADVQGIIEEESSFSILYMDLNNFKNVNDKRGHLAGDRYLMLFSKYMLEAIGQSNTLYRISGDEFLCICRNTATAALEKAIQAIRFEDAETGPFLGVSLGTARYPQDGKTFDQILAAADSRMYDDKRSRI